MCDYDLIGGGDPIGDDPAVNAGGEDALERELRRLCMDMVEPVTASFVCIAGTFKRHGHV